MEEQAHLLVSILTLVTANLTDTPLSGTIAGPSPRCVKWPAHGCLPRTWAWQRWAQTQVTYPLVCSSATVLKGGHFLGLTTRVTHAHPASRISLGWFCATRISKVFLCHPAQGVEINALYCFSLLQGGEPGGIKGESEMDPRNERPCKQCCHLVRWMSASLRGGLGRL